MASIWIGVLALLSVHTGLPFSWAQGLSTAQEAAFYDPEVTVTARKKLAQQWWSGCCQSTTELTESLRVMDRLRAAQVISNSEALGWIQKLRPELASHSEVRRRIPILKGTLRDAWLSPYEPVEGLPPNSFQQNQLAAGEVRKPLESKFARFRLEQIERYPSQYRPERIRLQDEWVSRLLARVPKAGSAPQIVFMAGPMGSGKSTSLDYLDRLGWISKDQYLVLDPDEIRQWIPEYSEWLKSDFAEFAALLTQHEAMDVLDITLRAALDSGLNVVVATSFRDQKHYQKALEQIRRAYPKYQLELIKVETTAERLLRVNRNLEYREGRITSVEAALRSSVEVEASVKNLKNQFDRMVIINNRGSAPVLQSIQWIRSPKGEQAVDCSTTWTKH